MCRFPTLAALMVLGLSGCAMDKESAVRAQLDEWVLLEETRYFNSTRDCTAALFSTGAKQVRSKVKKVQDVDRGLRLIGQGLVVAFDKTGASPGDIHQELDQADHMVGLAILVSGLAARDCFDEDLKDAFAEALNSDETVLIYDPENNATALFEPAGKRIFYTRGEL